LIARIQPGLEFDHGRSDARRSSQNGLFGGLFAGTNQIEHFVEKFARRQGKSIAEIPDEVMETLKRYSWPGNIRELQNVIERAVIMTTGSVLTLQATTHLTRNEEPAPIRTLADAERAHITSTLRETNLVVGGRRGAAAQLGLPRTSLLARMQRLGISSGTPAYGLAQADRLITSAPGRQAHAARFA
jgi:hypothetical protein